MPRYLGLCVEHGCSSIFNNEVLWNGTERNVYGSRVADDGADLVEGASVRGVLEGVKVGEGGGLDLWVGEGELRGFFEILGGVGGIGVAGEGEGGLRFGVYFNHWHLLLLIVLDKI